MIGFIAPFQILDHLDRLNVVKENAQEYHCTCPVCGDGGFKIEKKSGKYQGSSANVMSKIFEKKYVPWSEVKGNKTSKSKKKLRLARIEKVSDRPEAQSGKIPAWLVKQGIPAEAVETRYWYSKTQWVSRFEWTTSKGKEKTIRQGHTKSNGLIQWKKGQRNGDPINSLKPSTNAKTSGFRC